MSGSCRFSRQGQSAVLTIIPPFGWTSLPACMDAMQRLDASMDTLNIDVSALEELDNAGLGLLLLLRQQAVENGLQPRLRAPQGLVQDVLMLSKLDRLFDVDSGGDMDLEEIRESD